MVNLSNGLNELKRKRSDDLVRPQDAYQMI